MYNKQFITIIVHVGVTLPSHACIFTHHQLVRILTYAYFEIPPKLYTDSCNKYYYANCHYSLLPLALSTSCRH